MAIFVPHQNVKLDLSFGQAVNKAIEEYINPELKKKQAKEFKIAGIEISKSGKAKLYFDSEVTLAIEFKNKKLNTKDIGKNVGMDLKDINDVSWYDQKLAKNSAKILIWRFNENWWVFYADLKKRKNLEEKFNVRQTFKIRGGGYLPLKMRRQEKNKVIDSWREDFESEIPLMWKRHITVSQKYRGVMVYDGNYFDLFFQAQDLYVLGYYYQSVTTCRIAAEQALVSILTKSGKVFDIYKNRRGKQKLKSIEDLVETCRSPRLFKNKFPINKSSAKKLNQISTIASELVHPKNEISELKEYKEKAIKCMDNLQYVIKNHLNFIKDKGVVSGFKKAGKTKRLK